MNIKMLATVGVLIACLVNTQAQDIHNFSVDGNNNHGAKSIYDQELLYDGSGGSMTDIVPPVAPENSRFDINMYAIRGPQRGTPEFDVWSPALVDSMRKHGDRGMLTNAYLLSRRMTAAEVSAMVGATNGEAIWFPIHVIAKSAEDKFRADLLTFYGDSSDRNNYLDGSASLAADPNYTFTHRLVGVLWGSGGRGVNDTVFSSVINGNLSSRMVNELIFIGAQLNFFTYQDDAGFTAIHNYVESHSNFVIKGTWVLRDTASNVLAMSSISRGTKYGPLVTDMATPIVTRDGTNIWVTIPMRIPYENSVILERTFGLPARWEGLGIWNPGQLARFPIGTNSMAFFRLKYL